MHLIQGEFYHIYNRGNNQQLIFFTDKNYLFFIKKLRDHISPVANIISYCLMPNHFHLIIQANENSIKERPGFGGKTMQEFAYRIGILLSSYTQAINKQNNTTGSLFQQKTKAKILSGQINGRNESYLETCFFYIHNNPLSANIVCNLLDWKYSSYLDYIEVRNGTLCKKEILFAFVGLNKEDILHRTATDVSQAIIEKLY
jgi:putative transposase